MTRRLFSLFVAILLMTGAIAVSHPFPAGAASGQTVVTQACSGGSVIASFVWQGNDPSAKEQWLDLSLFDNSWQPHSFMSAGPLSGSTVSFSWAGLPSRVPFVVRMNQLLPDGSWDPSPNTRFTSMDCAVAVSTTVPAPSASTTSSSTTSTTASSPSTAASSSTSSVGSTSGTGSTTSSATTAAVSSPKLTLFTSPVPKGYDDKRPYGTIGYFLAAPGFDLDALKAGLTVTMVGPGGAVSRTLNATTGGWTYDTSIPGGLAVWMNPAMPMATYTVTITLPNGTSASGGFFHFVPSAG